MFRTSLLVKRIQQTILSLMLNYSPIKRHDPRTPSPLEKHSKFQPLNLISLALLSGLSRIGFRASTKTTSTDVERCQLCTSTAIGAEAHAP